MSTRILLGDCRETLLSLPSNSVQCIVTSPPYWALRSYLPDDHPDKRFEIGSEPTLRVDAIVDVMMECHRVLRPDGVLFLNLGDAYAGSGRGGNSAEITGIGKNASQVNIRKRPTTQSARRDDIEIPRSDVRVEGLKSKDMMGQPWRVAFALQAAGWWLRQEIIWAKPNPMPESVRDRCTKSHEHVFLLSKSERYFWNHTDFQEPVNGNAHARQPTVKGWATEGTHEAQEWAQNDAQGKARHDSTAARKARVKDDHKSVPDAMRNGIRPATPKAALATVANAGGYADGKSERLGRGPGWRAKNNESMDAALAEMVETRNPRSVWTIPTHGFSGAHFATFPPALAEKCITAGTREGDTVLDPFGGAGTVALVAERMHRNSILCELDERSVKMADERVRDDAPLLAVVAHG